MYKLIALPNGKLSVHSSFDGKWIGVYSWEEVFALGLMED